MVFLSDALSRIGLIGKLLFFFPDRKTTLLLAHQEKKKKKSKIRGKAITKFLFCHIQSKDIFLSSEFS